MLNTLIEKSIRIPNIVNEKQQNQKIQQNFRIPTSLHDLK